MKKEIRDKERKLFQESMALRRLDLTNTDYKQSLEIRKKQDDAWQKHLFYKGYLEQLEKEKKKNE